MEIHLDLHRLVLRDENREALDAVCRVLQSSPKTFLVMPIDLIGHLEQLSAQSGGNLVEWLGLLLLLDLKGRLFVEATRPVSSWLAQKNAIPMPSRVYFTVPEKLIGMFKAFESFKDDQVGVVIRRRLTRQLLGHHSPDEVDKLVDKSWNDDVEFLTIWLPEKVSSEAKALASHLDLSLSDVLRNALFIHLWGRLGFVKCSADGRWLQKRRQEDSDDAICFSLRRTYVPEEHELPPNDLPAHRNQVATGLLPRRVERIAVRGKSTAACKVWLPSAMNALLLAASRESGLRKSDYCRDVVINTMYGHRRSTYRRLVPGVCGELSRERLPST